MTGQALIVFDEVNTYTDARGYRSCRICRRAAARRYYWKAK